MKALRPALWRTCRGIACESRLRLLWALFAQNELCVCAAAKQTGMGEAQASVQLRALNARGLISSRR
jgi:DNA-binding transcriptional ArsR family regulator